MHFYCCAALCKCRTSKYWNCIVSCCVIARRSLHLFVYRVVYFVAGATKRCLTSPVTASWCCAWLKCNILMPTLESNRYQIELTLNDGNTRATISVHTQLVKPAVAMALGRGAWRNSSAPIIIGIGPDTAHID
jgi:hypothetical protein